MSTMMMDQAVHMGDLMNWQVDPDAGMVDPQLSAQFLPGFNEKQSEPMTIDPTLWQTPIDTSQRFDIVQPQGYQPEEDNDGNSAPNSPPYETRARAAKATRTDSKSSVPSLSSGSTGDSESPPSQAKHTRPKTTKKQESKPARKKQKTSKKAAADDQVEEDDSKRNKYLERNRVAASKCRQKKKVWVNDLESQKSELERKHHTLQRDYNTLVNEVTQLKNELMEHAACGDPRINGWIETEAKRFVARAADVGQMDQDRRMSSGSAVRRPSMSGSAVQQPSPTMSSEAFSQSPVIKEEINFDHMPDNMFE